MRLVHEILRLSATDLANHLGCAHLSQQSRAAAEGRAKKPKWHDPVAAILQQRGIEHEAAYLAHLHEAEGLTVTAIPLDAAERDGMERTLAAMRSGAPLIYQAPLGNARWYGRADFLRRVEAPSTLGSWSYEVIDAKLATETRAGTILQLCVYSELLADCQGAWPQRAYVVAPHHGFDPEPHRLTDYAAYYRLVKQKLEEAIARDDVRTYPEPVMQCEVCAWWGPCNARRRADDHLCFVAGISRMQIKELRRIDVTSLERLAQLREVPKPARGSRDALTRVRDQAAIQFKARVLATPQHEILKPIDQTHGLAMLPEPSSYDMFLDLEGDRLALDGGREYLFGYLASGGYVPVWAMNPAEEKQAFERLVDSILAAFRAHPDIHVYHFGAYEPTAFKRLSGRYATREIELDTILRAELFVDLHTIVKHALKASVESYSIKELEQFYGFAREQDMRAATTSRRAIEWAIEMKENVRGAADLMPHVAAVERYNREDCVSAEKLRAWLEALRADVKRERGIELPRPALKSGDASDKIEEVAEETQRVIARLLDGVPADPAERDEEQQARWLAAHLLEWHRREDKAAWWEYFRLRDLPLDEYLDERSALAGLEYVETIGGTAKRPIHRYAFPPQDHDIRKGDDACVPDGSTIGSIEELDLSSRTVDIQHSGKWSELHPERFFVKRNVPSGGKPAALLALGRWIAEHGIDAPGEHRAARDLILRRPPRLIASSQGLATSRRAHARVGGQLDLLEAAAPVDDEVTTACRVALELDHGVLPIQGPPGTGKTFTGSQMIVDLVKAGKKVGVTAVSHEVIRNLLGGCIEAAEREDIAGFKCLHKGKPKESAPEALHAFDDYKRIHALFDHGEYRVLGGTSWLWARADFQQSVDVLFIDEAGQMSLADVLAVTGAAKSLVLLGDPQQLEQPQQASHPPGTQASALEHILGGRKTIPNDAGLFLQQTRRLHPAICEFTAELFYENRLSAHPGLEKQAVVSSTRFPEAGLAYVPVEHEGNQSRAVEEVEAIAAIAAELTRDAVWRDSAGAERPLTRGDLMIVAPYNAQVAALAAGLPGIRVGTVDKFQGQQAPVVIVSLTTSSPDEAPRGMSFLYSANRLNVATSRAKGLCILVGNPKLFEPDCRTPEQMRLANAFCRYLEMARIV
jgi:uncharacterized protein